MTKIRKKALIALYVVLIGVALLYALFPDDAVRSALVNRIQRDVPDLRVSIGELKPAFPLALSMGDVTFSKNGTVVFSAGRLTLTPRWISLFTSKKEVKFRAVAYRGKMSGVISSIQGSGNGSFSISGIFTELQLDQIPALQENINMRLSGSASGRLQFDDVSVQQTFGGGELLVTDCTVIPSAPILEVDRLNFQKIELAFDVEGNKLELQRGEFWGSEINATLSGNIVIEAPTDRSILDMDIIVTPQRLFLSKLDDASSAELISSILSGQDKLNLRLTGLLGSPRVAFGASR